MKNSKTTFLFAFSSSILALTAGDCGTPQSADCPKITAAASCTDDKGCLAVGSADAFVCVTKPTSCSGYTALKDKKGASKAKDLCPAATCDFDDNTLVCKNKSGISSCEFNPNFCTDWKLRKASDVNGACTASYAIFACRRLPPPAGSDDCAPTIDAAASAKCQMTGNVCKSAGSTQYPQYDQGLKNDPDLCVIVKG